MLIVRDIVQRFGERTVLDGLALRVEAGEHVALVGGNGAGKTTLLRCIAGTIVPDAGDISVGGHTAGTRQAARLTGISLSQERSFYQRLTGRQNLELFGGFHLGSRRAAVAAVEAITEELELREIAARRVDQCSTGMTQQLALARALIGEPCLVLLDEPTRSLDDAAIDRMWGALQRRPDLALLIATHHAEDRARCSRHVDPRA
jgi:ABC-type multidrug transport system ATPase subunit